MLRTFLINLIIFLPVYVLSQQTNSLFKVSETKNLLIREWTANDGLASNSTRKIGKTKEGFLFICTYNGISLFDGKNFQNYTSSNVPVMKTNIVADFCVDKDSIFWIATYRGIITFDGTDFSAPEGLKQLESLNIQSIDIDKSGTLWIGSVADGLFKYKDKNLEQVKEIKDLDKTIVSLIYSDNNGHTWIGTESGLLYKYDGKKYKKIFHDRVENSMLSAIQDRKGNLFFGTRNGLYTYKNDTIAEITGTTNFINDITIDDFDRMWLSTNSGVFLYKDGLQNVTSFFRNNELTNQIILSMYFDVNGSIWVATYRKGILQVRIGAFENFPFTEAGINEVPSAIEQINDSTIWIGTDEGNVYQLQNGSYKHIKLKTNLNSSRIKSIFLDSKNNIWVCSYYGLLKISNGYEKILNTSTGFNDNTIRGIVENKDGSYWVATNQSGIYKITEDLKVLKQLNTSNGLSSNFVLTIVKGKNEKLYAATKSGLDLIKNDQIIHKYSTENGLIEDMVFNIYEDKDERLWIATIGGLSMIKDGKITNFTKKNGMSDDKVFDVIEDDSGFLWLPTISSILRVKKDELLELSRKETNKFNCVSFGKSDGIYDSQYVGASKAFKLNNGNIAINTLSGLSILNPKIANSSKSDKKLLINSIITESETYKINKSELVLPSSNKYLQINYSYIDFIYPDKVTFLYRLEPFDNEWQSAGNERFVRYTNIPKGNYTFKIKAKVKSQGDIELIKTIDFAIKPAFYESIWFKLLISAIVIFLIWISYFLRIRRIQVQKALLEKEVADRTNEISKQKEAIEKNLYDLETQKEEIAEKNEEILIARNRIEQAYINLKLLSDLGKEITSSLSEKDIIKTVYSNISYTMDVDLIGIGIIDREEEIIRFNSTIYKGQKLDNFTVDLDTANCILCHSVNNDVAVVSNNFPKDYPNFGRSFPDIKAIKPLTSVIVIPIRPKDEITGVLTIQSFRKGSYSDYHFNLIGNLAVYIGIAIENTKTYEKIQSQKDELQKVNAAKDRMFSIIGHDLRSPVGTIKSFLDVIIDNPEMTNSQNTIKIFKTMQQSLGSAYSLLDNLLLWARSQRDQLEFKPSVFEIEGPVRESISLVFDAAKNKNITIETELEPKVKVFADHNMITTVLRNLISNAIKFTPNNGSVKVVVVLSKEKNKKNIEMAKIKVIDNGIGINKDNIDKILKVNEVFSTPGTNKEQGSGLGISICIDFLKKHKQTLHVENNQDVSGTTGSTFEFQLPVNCEN